MALPAALFESDLASASKLGAVLASAGFDRWLQPASTARPPVQWVTAFAPPPALPLITATARVLESSGDADHDDDSAPRVCILEFIHLWASSIDPLPLNLRDDMTRDAIEFLQSPLVADKPMYERIRFLTNKGLALNEVAHAIAVAKLPVTLADYNRGLRVLREDQMYNAEQFLASPAIANKTWAAKLAFLREKGLTPDELAEVNDALGHLDATNSSSAGAAAAAKLSGATTTTTTSPPPPSHARAVVFLQSEAARKTPKADLLAFLLKQGMTPKEAHDAAVAAFDAELASLALAAASANKPTAEPARRIGANAAVEQAVAFLGTPAARASKPEELRAFLVKKGLSAADVDEAFARTAALRPAPGDEVAKAAAFLSNPSVRQRSTEEKIAFLRAQGVSEDAIQLALARVGGSLNSNPSSATPGLPPPPPAKPASPQDVAAVLRVPVEALIARGGLVAVCAVAAGAQLARVGGWSPPEPAVLDTVDSPAYEDALGGVAEAGGFDYVAAVLGQSGSMRAVDAQLMLARIVHLRVMPRLSVQPIDAALVDKLQRTSVLALAGTLRGGLQFGWGVLATGDESGAARQALRGASPPSAQVGLAVVYGDAGFDATTLPSLVLALFGASLDCAWGGSSAAEELDAIAQAAQAFVRGAAFKLTSVVANAVIAAGKASPASVVDACVAHSVQVYRRAGGACAPATRRCVLKAYDANDAPRSFEDVLGAHAGVARFLSSCFLCYVVVLEPLVGSDTALALKAWDALANVACGVVPVPDASRLQRWLGTLVAFEPDAWQNVARLLSAHAKPRADEEDWPRAARVEYLFFSGAALLDEAWKRASASAVEDEPALSPALLFGAGQGLPSLNLRCHSMLIQGVQRCRVPAERASDLGAGAATVPAFLRISASACAKGRVEVATTALAVSSTMVALGSSAQAEAAEVAMRGFDAVLAAAMQHEREPRGKTVMTLVFTSVKAVPLDVLALCLDRMLGVVRAALYRTGGARDVLDALLGVVERVDDAQRRALLCAWWTYSVAPLLGPGARL